MLSPWLRAGARLAGVLALTSPARADEAAAMKQLDREARQSKDYDEVKALLRKLDDVSETTRLGACEALERMNKTHSLYAYREDLVPPLARLAVGDPSEDLRERARRALGHVLGYEVRP